jgi:hypothetical protein
MKMLWKSMIQRCHNPRNPSYPSYGGRGITVCDRWRSYALFALDMGPRPTPIHTLDRIDNDRGYEPGNVRWASRREQALNRYTTRLISFRGKKKSISDWAREFGLVPATLWSRIEAGWPLDRALKSAPDSRFGRGEQPLKRTHRVHEIGNTRKPVYVVDNASEVTL